MQTRQPGRLQVLLRRHQGRCSVQNAQSNLALRNAISRRGSFGTTSVRQAQKRERRLEVLDHDSTARTAR